MVRSVGKSVAGQRRCLVAELLRVFRRKTCESFRHQVGRSAWSIRVRWVATSFAKYLRGQNQRFAAHNRTEASELSEWQPDKGLAVVIIEGLLEQFAFRLAHLDLMIKIEDSWASVVQNFETRAPRDAINHITLCIALRESRFCDCSQIGRISRCGNAIVSVARDGQGGLPARLSERVIVVGEGELRHRLVTALPLCDALRNG